MKNTWKTINKLLGNFHNREEVRAMETTEGRLTDSQQIAEFLCDYFANEGKRLCDNLACPYKLIAFLGRRMANSVCFLFLINVYLNI